jgi:RES domain-containing protein
VEVASTETDVRAWRIDGTGRGALDGEESRDDGGRWHRPGRPLVYAASSCALALAEFLVHLKEETGTLQALEIDVPDDLRFDYIRADSLPEDWRTPRHEACCDSGEQWLATPFEKRGAILLVPSAVVPLELNVIVDPWHPDAARVSIVETHAFPLDDRLLEAGERVR